jgi:phosphatidylinositol glycan class C protein
VHFLEEMKKNQFVRTYAYSDIVKDTFVIIQQLSFIVVFAYMFALIHQHQISLRTIVSIDIAGLFLGGVCFVVLWQEKHGRQFPPGDILDFARQGVIFSSILLIISPIFRTLTVTFSDDTIWAMGIIAMFLHLLFTDYNYLNANSDQHTPGVAINAAIFAVTILASRIKSPLYGGALIAFGIHCFHLSPVLRHLIKSFSLVVHVGATFLLCGVTMGCLLQVPLLAALFASCVVMICFVVPWFFIKLQGTSKFQINGPWDEAKPRNSVAAAEWANAGLLS